MRPREKVEEAHKYFDQDQTTENCEALNVATQLLCSAHSIRGEELMEKVQRVEGAQGEHQYNEAWRGINEMCGQKKPKEGQVTGNSPKKE